MLPQPTTNLKLIDLNVAQHNIRLLNCNKAQVINYLEGNNIHVYIASETWLKPTDNFFLKNYAFVDHRRSDGYAGAAICIKNNITFREITLPDFRTINAVAIETMNLEVNLTFFSIYVPAKKAELPEALVRQDLISLLDTIKKTKNGIIGGDFNAFNNVWGSSYNDDRGILLTNELENFCLLNDGTPTRIPNGKTKSNPLDLSFATSNIFDRIKWHVKMENLGSDHLIVLMQLNLMMNSEEIKVKPKIDYEVFWNNIVELEVKDMTSLSDFILAVEGAKQEATKRPQTLRNPKFIPKPYWNEEIRALHKQKKAALIKYFRNMTTGNLINFKRLNAIFKRKLKGARSDSWRQWAESLSPRSSVKDIFRKFKRLSNYRVPNQPNVMFQNPKMVEKFLNKLCKVDAPSSDCMTVNSNTEEPFTM